MGCPSHIRGVEPAQFTIHNLCEDNSLVSAFEFVPGEDVRSVGAVCETWSKLVTGDYLRNHLLERFYFGPKDWERFFGVEVDKEFPPVPKNLIDILNSPCPSFPGKLIKHMSFVIFIPSVINGKPFDLNVLKEAIENSPKKPSPEFECHISSISDKLRGFQRSKPGWILMTREVVPGSRQMTHEDQVRWIETQSPAYREPMALEALAVAVTRFVKNHEFLYGKGTVTRCREKMDVGSGDETSVNVGEFFDKKIYVYSLRPFESQRVGMAAVRDLLEKGPGEKKFCITLKPLDAHKAETISGDARFRIAKTNKPNQFLVVCSEDLVGELQAIVEG